MSEVITILVLGFDEQDDLSNTLFEAGYVPIVRGNMMEALSKLKHEPFAAVLVDKNHSEEDTLEFILNIRDMDGQIPIIVFGTIDNEDENRVLSKQNNTCLVGESYNEIKNEIKRLLKN